MGKKLSDMTLEELWTLFPIVLTEHNAQWKTWYAEQEAEIRRLLPAEWIAAVSHIGSTAVDGLWAKPIVDILVELHASCDPSFAARILRGNGWILMNHSDNRFSFNKGYTEDGFAERVFHLHLRMAGDNDELYFRDYLIDHPDEARKYERLKLSLWKPFEHDRDGYTQAKSEMVAALTRAARKEYPDRYPSR